MKRELRQCDCAKYGNKPHIVRLFGHKYCEYCQSPDETEWWEELAPSQRAACGVWDDLRGRRGFKQEIEPEIEREILTTWARIIGECY